MHVITASTPSLQPATSSPRPRLPALPAVRLAIGALLLALCTAIGCDRGQHPGQVGQPAPPFTVADGDHTVDLRQFRGKVVVLNFWASWCAPCLVELPGLEALQRDLPQVAVVGVSFDEDHAAYTRFVTRHSVSFLTVNDTSHHANELYGSFRPPETYVIDKAGTVRRKFIGPQDWTSPEIEDFLRKLAA